MYQRQLISAGVVGAPVCNAQSQVSRVLADINLEQGLRVSQIDVAKVHTCTANWTYGAMRFKMHTQRQPPAVRLCETRRPRQQCAGVSRAQSVVSVGRVAADGCVWLNLETAWLVAMADAPDAFRSVMPSPGRGTVWYQF